MPNVFEIWNLKFHGNLKQKLQMKCSMNGLLLLCLHIFGFIKTSIVVVCTKVKTFLWEKLTKQIFLVKVTKLAKSWWWRSHSFGFTKSFNFNLKLPQKFRLKLIFGNNIIAISIGKKTFRTIWIHKKTNNE